MNLLHERHAAGDAMGERPLRLRLRLHGLMQAPFCCSGALVSEAQFRPNALQLSREPLTGFICSLQRFGGLDALSPLTSSRRCCGSRVCAGPIV